MTDTDQSTQPTTKPEPTPAPRPRIYVDELRDKHAYNGRMTIVFRPGEELTSDNMIDIAKKHGVALRERFI